MRNIKDSGVNALYDEARDCAGAGAHTAAVMLCRTILMHLAVAHGADKNNTFQYYVGFLSDKGYVPPNGKAWVDLIRSKGGEAVHDIRVMTQADSEPIIRFTEMLLRFVYEFPSMIK